MRISTLSSAAFAAFVSAETYDLYAGFFAGTTLVRLQFDDATNALTIAENTTIPYGDGQKWIALDSRKQNLYVATTNGFQSYSIGSDLSLTYSGNTSMTSACSNANHIAVTSVAPYTVYGITYSSCPTLAISVDATGALADNFANASYSSTASNIHGGAVSALGDFLYSADDPGNSVYVHAVDATAGSVEEIQRLTAAEGSDPRHLAVHPKGGFVYVDYEAASAVGVYTRDNTTGLLTDTNTTYSLLPEGFTNSSSYWADEVIFSSTGESPKYLFAATRSHTTDIPGYVSAFSLDADTGAIVKQLFLLPTTNSGGSANSVGPVSWSEEYFTITDSGSNFIEMWKIADDASTASIVAHLATEAGPANVVSL